jgi:hypothetical protein
MPNTTQWCGFDTQRRRPEGGQGNHPAGRSCADGSRSYEVSGLQFAHPRAWIRKVALNLLSGRALVEAPGDVLPEVPELVPGHAELTDQAADVVAALGLVADVKARALIAFTWTTSLAGHCRRAGDHRATGSRPA